MHEDDLPIRESKEESEHSVKTWKLRDPEIKNEYQQTVERKYEGGATSVEQAWHRLKTAVVEAATETCGRSKGGKREERETWWWNADVRAALKEKKEKFKIWQRTPDARTRMEYTRARNQAKRVIGRAKFEAWTELYEELDTSEGEERIYKIAKQREETQRDTGSMTVIKDSSRNILTGDELIKTRWREYFEQLLNVENERETLHQVRPTEGPTQNITAAEIKTALKKMKKGKATGCSEVSIDMIQALQETGQEMC